MATIVKFPGKKRVTWQAKVRRKGTVQNRTFHTKREAEDWARSIENAIAHDQYEKLPTHNHTVGELIDLYVDRYLREKAPKTQDTQGRYLQWWKQNLGDTTLMNINPSILEDYIQVLRKKGYAASTVNGFINALSPAFTL